MLRRQNEHVSGGVKLRQLIRGSRRRKSARSAQVSCHYLPAQDPFMDVRRTTYPPVGARKGVTTIEFVTRC